MSPESLRPDPYPDDWPVSRAFVLLPRLRVTGANLISSPLSWGFPPPSAFTGLGYALQLRLQQRCPGLRIEGVGVSCHHCEPQTSDGYVKTLKLSRNPLNASGESSAFVEEGRVHLEVSLLLDLHARLPLTQSELDLHPFASMLMTELGGMRIAGGSVQLGRRQAKAWLLDAEPSPETLQRDIAKRLLPGRVLVSRNSLLAAHLAEMQQSNPDATTLDAWLDLQAVHYKPDELAPAEEAMDSLEPSPSNAKLPSMAEVKGKESQTAVQTTAKARRTAWTATRRKPGWLVPVPMGYSAIAPLAPAGSVKNARDPHVPFCFVESVLGIGEWLSPFAVKNPEHWFWRHRALVEQGLYLVENAYQAE